MAKERYTISHILKANAIKNSIEIICFSGKCTFWVANNICYMVSGGEKTNVPFFVTVLDAPIVCSSSQITLVSLAGLAPECRYLSHVGSPSKDVLQASSCSLASVKVGWELLLVGKSHVVQKQLCPPLFKLFQSFAHDFSLSNYWRGLKHFRLGAILI